jgi:hypothetical protein
VTVTDSSKAVDKKGLRLLLVASSYLGSLLGATSYFGSIECSVFLGHIWLKQSVFSVAATLVGLISEP